MAPAVRLKELDKKIGGMTNRELLANISDPAERRQLGLTIEPFEFVMEVESFIERTLDRLQAIAQKQWGVAEFDLHYALNYRDSPKGRSNAGTRSAQWRSNYEMHDKERGPCINLNAVWSRMHDGGFDEYSHIQLDPQIGGIATPDWKAYMEVLLAHEYAHVLEYRITDKSSFPFHEPRKCHGHGANWQNIYRWLRIKTGHVLTKSTNFATLEKMIAATRPKCAFCGQPFLAKRADAKTCSAKCKTYLSRQRKQQSTDA